MKSNPTCVICKHAFPEQKATNSILDSIPICKPCRVAWIKEGIAMESGEKVYHRPSIICRLRERSENIYNGIQATLPGVRPREPREKVSPYPKEFDEAFKEMIRERFNRTCFLCGLHESEHKTKLHVHHIDYNKENMDMNNFIPCCYKCHGQTTGNREYWEYTIKRTLKAGRFIDIP